MRKLFETIVFIIGVLVITSCSNDSQINDVLPTKSRSIENASQKDIFNFKYKEVFYSAEYDIVDSTMIFVDSEIADMICNLESDPYVATLNYPDGMVEYFDSNKDLEESVKANKVIYKTPKKELSYWVLLGMQLKVYEHADFQGEMLSFQPRFECPDMRNVYNAPLMGNIVDFNDKISSFQLIGSLVHNSSLPLLGPNTKVYHTGIVTFYEDANYAYGSASFLIDRDHPQISHSNFKKVKRCPTCKYNMNDRTSSIKLYWID